MKKLSTIVATGAVLVSGVTFANSVSSANGVTTCIYDKPGTYTFVPRQNAVAELLVVGGGGSGGGSWGAAGGGGAGGFLHKEAVLLRAMKSYTVVVGQGGASVGGWTQGEDGTASSFGDALAGGGAGGGANQPGHNAPDVPAGAVQGSGSGASIWASPGGTGATAGASGQGNVSGHGGGGGGAGGNATTWQGGSGISCLITGTEVVYAIGGAGGSSTDDGVTAPSGETPGSAGAGADSGNRAGEMSGAGANGIVVLRYEGDVPFIRDCDSEIVQQGNPVYVYSSAGAHTFTAAETGCYEYFIVGGGGAGGGAAGAEPSIGRYGGQGGSGGKVTSGRLMLKADEAITVTIGAGGTKKTTGAEGEGTFGWGNGLPGGTSSLSYVGGTEIASAAGGEGGTCYGGAMKGLPGYDANGALGGPGVENNWLGDVKYYGAAGKGAGENQPSVAGAAGSGAGSSGAGNKNAQGNPESPAEGGSGVVLIRKAGAISFADSSTFTAPVTGYYEAFLVGGGGAGGGADGGGGQGGSGGKVVRAVVSLQEGDACPVTIGAGGVMTNWRWGDGSTGEATTLTLPSQEILTAAGGAGGVCYSGDEKGTDGKDANGVRGGPGVANDWLGETKYYGVAGKAASGTNPSVAGAANSGNGSSGSGEAADVGTKGNPAPGGSGFALIRPIDPADYGIFAVSCARGRIEVLGGSFNRFDLVGENPKASLMLSADGVNFSEAKSVALGMDGAFEFTVADESSVAVKVVFSGSLATLESAVTALNREWVWTRVGNEIVCGDWKFAVADVTDGLAVTLCTGAPAGNLVPELPKSVGGKAIVEIGAGVLWNTMVAGLEIPKSVTGLSGAAFENAKGLTSIIFNGALPTIDTAAGALFAGIGGRVDTFVRDASSYRSVASAPIDHKAVAVWLDPPADASARANKFIRLGRTFGLIVYVR